MTRLTPTEEKILTIATFSYVLWLHFRVAISFFDEASVHSFLIGTLDLGQQEMALDLSTFDLLWPCVCEQMPSAFVPSGKGVVWPIADLSIAIGYSGLPVPPPQLDASGIQTGIAYLACAKAIVDGFAPLCESLHRNSGSAFQQAGWR
jgi:hypothetical protein